MRKGINPVVSYVMIIALVMTVSIGTYVWAQYKTDTLKDPPAVLSMKDQMLSIDSAIQNVAHGDINFTTQLEVHYPVGTLAVSGSQDSVKYFASIRGEVYGRVNVTNLADDCKGQGGNEQCDVGCTVIEDSNLGVQMARILQTNVFRGAVGTRGQFVEIMACYDDIDIVVESTCTGGSGPYRTVKIRKVGYTQTKPKVAVGVC